ncbi:MAG: GNAT family N-acetyltransferase [Chitinophagaceae bacterium]|nr:GNAT family N-acetyltransferase [Chitinophagaceae bacterium]
MQGVSYSIKSVQAADSAALYTLSAAEGWNQSEADWLFFINNAQHKAIASFEKDRIIGSTTAVCYENRLAWIGMVVVQQAYRGMGIGKSLVQHVLNQLREFPFIQLDATPMGLPLYQHLGFKEEDSIIRMVNPSVKPVETASKDSTILEVTRENISEIVSFDEGVFGVSRHSVIRYLLESCPRISGAIVGNNQLNGFISGRPGRLFYQLGPVEANQYREAETLISYALKNLEGKSVVIDLPRDKEKMIDFLRDNGFTIQRSFSRMYYANEPLKGEKEKLFAIAGPEFG